MTPLAIAFLPLTDSAPLIAASERGFAEAEGIALRLVRDTSWAAVRDRLVYGQVQCAHLLAPLAVAVTLGLSQTPCAIAAPFKLNDNGNALTLSSELAAALDPDPRRRVADPIATAHDFAAAIGLHRRKPIIGIVHRFSSHAMMLRYWLGYAGINPDRDVTLRVLPPSLMTQALRLGEVDGFIAGEPWSSVSVAQGIGEIAATGVNIWQRGVEKVLATRADWAEANGDQLDRLLRALDRAAAWCDDPANHDDLAALLARPEYVDQPPGLIAQALSGCMPLRQDGEPVRQSDFLVFHRGAANFPWRSQALWIYSQFVRWNMVEPSVEAERAAAGVFRSDLYRRALAGRGVAMPGASMKVEGSLKQPTPAASHEGSLTLAPDRFFDGLAFDPQNLAGYLEALRAS
ncbi:CmpA/NrtA family ABC transporter substrate-binding protein [Sphingomonas xinjiangensis]|uniref:NitT/TauT family transport system ATP-binding protein n=1 Tax=Sphingomonas xinjiangensis TaxID=643568 RepID=A0A840YNG4_9SPHN|nr:CmpA/NrtA family ABC transporter substrate-binding protein [Sphingomonas xinjiangensis]MBB5711776.1 NitT/TauT family transport system ATP-binding protein [Sphingomonas xinjiangensis]